MDLTIHDQQLSCDLQLDTCTPATGNWIATPQVARTQAFVSSAASRYAPNGLYLYFELPRPNGAVAHVELDLPAGSGVGGPSGGPFLSYVEYLGGKAVFRSHRASGRLEVPLSDGSCACRDGRLELRFTDPGADGALGSDDDLFRRLSRGRFAWGEGHFCRGARLLDLPDDMVVVDIPGDCPPAPSAPSGRSGAGGSIEYEGGGGCYAEDGHYEDDTGCDYDDGTGGYGESSYEDTGCDGDTSDPGYSEDYGCEGDTSDSYDSYDSSGCEGDTSSDYDSASCEGDAYAAGRGARRRGRRSTSAGMLPFALLGLLWAHLRRCGRRARSGRDQ